MRPPGEIIIHGAANTVLILTGPVGIATATGTIMPFGGIPLNAPDILWVGTDPAGWRVPWGEYEVNGVAYLFKPESLSGYITLYNGGSLDADITGSAVVGGSGYGVPDGALTSDDFFYVIRLYSL